ncbi:lantibiotic ABC transporter permease [Gordonibacter sp. An230]|nr:lantibiotic ABC transporter permease [Gordonibacter sp. An230]
MRRASAAARLTRALRSEALKLRRSPLAPLHLALALALGLAAGAYFGYAPWDSLLGADAFFQLLGAGAPLLAGLSCGLALDAEREAGECANLLGVPSRRIALAAKAAALWALGLSAAVVAALAFFAPVAAAGRATPPLATCLAAAGGVAAGSIGLYVVLTWTALRFGRNAAIGAGALGFLLAMGSMGGLANGLVTGTLSGEFGVELAAFLPFAWPSRLASLTVELAVAGQLGAAGQESALVSAFSQVAVTCAILTTALAAVSLARANRYEDRRRAGE